MTRTVAASTTVAVGQETTQPIYLIRMGWDVQSPDVERRVATWDTDISWNSETWTASGAKIQSINPSGGNLVLPNGDGDPWLDLIVNQGQRGKTLQVYEYQTSWGSPAGSNAEELFLGTMDASQITKNGIRITFVSALLNKSFPHTTITNEEYPYLLTTGARIYWGPDVIRVQ